MLRLHDLLDRVSVHGSHSAAAYMAAAMLPVLHRFASRRGLIIQTQGEPARVEPLSDSNSGIAKLKLDRPEAKNAIGKELLRAVQSTLKMIDNDSSVNALIMSFSAPGPISRKGG